MIKKSTLLLAVLAAVIAVGAGAATAKPEQQVTLKFLIANENRLGYDAMIPNFERVYPNIKIEPIYVPFAQLNSLVLSQYQAGNEPDLFNTAAGGASTIAVYALGSQGKLLDLTGSPWWKRTPKFQRKYLTVKGRVYGFVSGYSASGLAYNKDLFRSLGLTIPKTFSDLLALCQKVKAAGKIPIVAGLATPATSINMTSIMSVNFVYNKDPNWTLERIQKKVTFASSPLWQRMLQAIVQMKDGGCFQPAPQATTGTTEIQQMANGQALMMFVASQQLAVINSVNPNVKLGIIPFPADAAKDTNMPQTTAILTLAASARTQHPKEAKTFIDFVARPKQNALYAKVQGVVSGDDLVKGILPDYLADAAALLKAGKSIASPSSGWPRPDKGLFFPGFAGQIPGLFTGQRTPDQFLQNMDELWDRP